MPRACTPQQEELLQGEAHTPKVESNPRSLQLEKAQAQQQRPRAAKSKEIKIYKTPTNLTRAKDNPKETMSKSLEQAGIS